MSRLGICVIRKKTSANYDSLFRFNHLSKYGFNYDMTVLYRVFL